MNSISITPTKIGDCTLYQGDCLEIMPTLGKVDAVVTDPPYEEELHKAANKKTINKTRYDGRTLPDIDFEGVNKIRPKLCESFVTASQGWVIVFTLAEGVREWRDGLQKNGAKYDTCLAWVKPDAMPRFNGQGAARGFECAVTAWCATGYRSWNAGGKRGVYTHLVNGPKRHGVHPTEKPTSLMVELLSDFTNHGQTIFDPFMGSGTTGVACAKLGRKFIGIELEPKYFDIACKRIEDAYKQPDLFVEAPCKIKQAELVLE